MAELHLTPTERNSILDTVALLEADRRGDQEAVDLLLRVIDPRGAFLRGIRPAVEPPARPVSDVEEGNGG